MTSLRIVNGRIVDPANALDEVADLYVDKGLIRAVGENPPGYEPEKEINASGKIVCPGLVDLSARLGESGDEHSASIASETRAAASAGITTLCCPPDTAPVIDIPAIVELIHQRTQRAGKAKVVCLGALTQGLTGERLAEMHALKEIGCVGVSNAMSAVSNTEVMRRAMEYAATCGLKVFLQGEDYWLGSEGHMHHGEISTRLGIPGIPDTAETIAVARDLLLIEETGVSAHFGRLSTARAAEMVKQARDRGLPVTADVSIHHLHLTHEAVGWFNALCHVRPPLRTQADRAGLRRALGDNVISAICSDHQPHDEDGKMAPFIATEPGISGLESLLPLTLELVTDGTLGLSEAVAVLTQRPAEILDIPAGTLQIGAAADICIFDPEYTWSLTEDAMLSAGKNTPFIGRELKGRVTQTLLDGVLVYDCANSD